MKPNASVVFSADMIISLMRKQVKPEDMLIHVSKIRPVGNPWPIYKEVMDLEPPPATVVTVAMTPNQRFEVAKHLANKIKKLYHHNMESIGLNIPGEVNPDTYRCRNCKFILRITTAGNTAFFNEKVYALLRQDSETYTDDQGERHEKPMCRMSFLGNVKECEHVKSMR